MSPGTIVLTTVIVLTWNLFHGRAMPNAHRDLQPEFTARIAELEWDVALLQEVPPWWPAAIARASGASSRQARTSRNLLPWPRRVIARRWPDVIKSNGGGCNAILVRGHAILDHRVVVLRQRPERRVAHAVRLGGGWVGNLHAQVHSEAHAQADLATAAMALRGWAVEDTRPIVLGGDTNTRAPAPPGLAVLGGHDVDFVMARGMKLSGKIEALHHSPLSDHAPVRARLEPA